VKFCYNGEIEVVEGEGEKGKGRMIMNGRRKFPINYSLSGHHSQTVFKIY